MMFALFSITLLCLALSPSLGKSCSNTNRKECWICMEKDRACWMNFDKELSFYKAMKYCRRYNAFLIGKKFKDNYKPLLPYRLSEEIWTNLHRPRGEYYYHWFDKDPSVWFENPQSPWQVANGTEYKKGRDCFTWKYGTSPLTNRNCREKHRVYCYLEERDQFIRPKRQKRIGNTRVELEFKQEGHREVRPGEWEYNDEKDLQLTCKVQRGQRFKKPQYSIWLMKNGACLTSGVPPVLKVDLKNVTDPLFIGSNETVSYQGEYQCKVLLPKQTDLIESNKVTLLFEGIKTEIFDLKDSQPVYSPPQLMYKFDRKKKVENAAMRVEKLPYLIKPSWDYMRSRVDRKGNLLSRFHLYYNKSDYKDMRKNLLKTLYRKFKRPEIRDIDFVKCEPWFIKRKSTFWKMLKKPLNRVIEKSSRALQRCMLKRMKLRKKKERRRNRGRREH